MSLFSDVVAVLERARIDHALIGAAAMALHGVSRATADIDLFTVDKNSLRRALWDELEKNGATLRLLEGDFDDPLPVVFESPFPTTERWMSSSGATPGRRISSSPRSPCR